ncbi:MAG: phosphate ABC transporter permease PstA [Gammaproteobacteria bacterium]
MKQWFASGTPWVWLNAAAVTISIIMVAGLLLLIAVRGLGHFWPKNVVEFTLQQGDGVRQLALGEIHDSEQVTVERLRAAGYEVADGQEWIPRYLVKTGNRDLTGMDFRWLLASQIQQRRLPLDVVTVERREWGNFYGYVKALQHDGKVLAENEASWPLLQTHLHQAQALFERIHEIEKRDIGAINAEVERLRLRQRRLELGAEYTAERQRALAAQRAALDQRYAVLQGQLKKLYGELNRDAVLMTTVDGHEAVIPLAKVVRAYRANSMSLPGKIGFYFSKLWEFVSDEPREANTEGGIFPAIFGTVMMVLLMSVFVTPFGVVAAIYLREYARQGPLTRIIRIAVNNLASVPSIVYGVFGLGFFVYFLGGNIDQLFFPEALPAPTLGTPGILWASLTLALLTVPVVIVATEEGLARIPRAIREGSMALGATKAETLWRTVLPMASPAIMTGLILAIARAAGEVAPLMLVGVVKLAPSLPVDGNFPFLHLDRKFMHLGFHIYDVGFQSPNVEAARPLVYATALLLVVVIVALNLTAIYIRNRLREKYRALEQ